MASGSRYSWYWKEILLHCFAAIIRYNSSSTLYLSERETDSKILSLPRFRYYLHPPSPCPSLTSSPSLPALLPFHPNGRLLLSFPSPTNSTFIRPRNLWATLIWPTAKWRWWRTEAVTTVSRSRARTLAVACLPLLPNKNWTNGSKNYRFLEPHPKPTSNKLTTRYGKWERSPRTLLYSNKALVSTRSLTQRMSVISHPSSLCSPLSTFFSVHVLSVIQFLLFCWRI